MRTYWLIYFYFLKAFKRKRKKKKKKKKKEEKKRNHHPTNRENIFVFITIYKLQPINKAWYLRLSLSLSVSLSLPFLPKMKASLKGRYELEKSNSPAAAATVAFNAGDVKLRASLTDATVVNGPSLNGLALAVEKPGFFILDYNVPKKVLFTTPNFEVLFGHSHKSYPN